MNRVRFVELHRIYKIYNMKHLSIFLISFLTVLSVQAHINSITDDVTITVNGNKNLQIEIDGKDYNLTGSDVSGNKTTFTYNNLDRGQHTIKVIRTDQNTNRSNTILATFYLRDGFDMLIKINENGSLELIETIKNRISDNAELMSEANFNLLLRNIRNQRSSVKRSDEITIALGKANNYFTTNQVFKMLQLVNNESSRIKLAKLSYPVITDQSNFYQLYDLVKSQAAQRELENYVIKHNDDQNISVGMTDVNFNTLFQGIKNQWNVNTQISSLTNAFNSIENNFTTSQAIQLIQLISTESNRLGLAKLSYRSIVDKNNFNQLYSLLNNQSSQNELAVYVNNYNNSIDTNLSMSDANFSLLYQDIKNQWNASTQMTSLSNVFNNTSNFFSSYQASQLIQLVTVENNRLQLAKLSYRSITDPANFNQVYNLLHSQVSQNELAVYVNNYKQGNVTNNAMPDASFNTLLQGIKIQWNVSTQVNSISDAFSNINNYFNSYQASQLIQLLSSESNRLQVAKISYRSIIDPVNFNRIVNLISSTAGKNELTAYINNNYNTGISPNVAMSDTDFTTLIQSIQSQFLPFQQMTSLIDIFNKPGNFFTTGQAKQLIPLVSNESNRLQLAKLSYRTITDRDNFIQLNDLFGSLSSKNELDAYVKAYKE